MPIIDPIVIFRAETIRAALDRLSDEEGFELDAYVREGRPDQFCQRATAWLIAHGFSGPAVLVLPDKAVS